jgi:glycosyltransferase involved in cell wall biosynthesis
LENGMPDTAPLVTVVIPCFNQARFLPSAIASVERQSYPRVRALVVDDGSVDGTSDVAAELGVEVIRQPNSGLSGARNTGLARAAGDFVIFLDADDELLGDAVQRGVNALRRSPGMTCAVGRCIGVDEAGRPIPAAPQNIDTADLYRAWLQQNFVWTPAAAIFRRQALRQVGGFPRDVGPAADYAMYLALSRQKLVVDHGWPVARYRQHEASMSRDPRLMLRTTLEVLRRERWLLEPQYASEHARGVRNWRDWYGEQMVDQLRREWRAGSIRGRQLSMLATIAAQCPRTMLRHATRKLRLALHLTGRTAPAAERQRA